MKIYRLKDVDSGMITHEIIIKKHSIGYVDGDVFLVDSWVDDNIPYDYSYIGGFSIKFDLCSHWFFEGEDVRKPDGKYEEPDGYYHLCGSNSYYNFMVGIAFAVKVASMLMEILDDEHKNIEELRLLEGYEIVETTIS